MRQHRIRLRWRRYLMGVSVSVYVGLRSFTIRLERTRMWRPVT